jgi:mono/diheme cytochrome c family protein
MPATLLWGFDYAGEVKPAPLVLIPGLIASALVLAQTTKSTRDGIYTAAQAARGRIAYSERCLECHGRELEGDVETRPLVGGEFLTNWEGSTVQTLFDRIHNTMPGDKPGSLSRPEVADILSFILQMNGFPAGQDELSTRGEVLAQIRFDLPKQ